MKFVRITKELIDRVLLSVPRINLHYVAYKMQKKYNQLPCSHGWFPLHMETITKAIDDYVVGEYNRDILIRDIVYCHQRYLISPAEYFHFSFDKIHTSHSQRKEFLAEDMMNLILINEVGMMCCDELEDKYGLYIKLKSYYKRDVCKVESEADYTEYVQFINNHDNYFVKPNSSSCGRGCYKVSASLHTHTRNAESQFHSLLMDNGSVIEELIEQDESMKQWNSTSVQTIRLNTILTEHGFYALSAAIRIGEMNEVVDNAASGGYVAAIDIQTGIVISDAINYKRKIHHKNASLKGWKVPEWDLLLKMANEIQEKIPHQRYVGWDFAYSKKGWCLVEANWGEILSQFALAKGIRTEFEKRITTR